MIRIMIQEAAIYKTLLRGSAAALVAIFLVSPAFGDTPLPVIPKAKGERCVEPTNVIRRNHMVLLRHQRDETLREGVRSKKHSLNECLTCHAVNGIDDKPVSIKSEKHFCNSCHAYAAVTIDCFDCHASTPGDEKAITGNKL